MIPWYEAQVNDLVVFVALLMAVLLKVASRSYYLAGAIAVVVLFIRQHIRIFLFESVIVFLAYIVYAPGQISSPAVW